MTWIIIVVLGVAALLLVFKLFKQLVKLALVVVPLVAVGAGIWYFSPRAPEIRDSARQAGKEAAEKIEKVAGEVITKAAEAARNGAGDALERASEWVKGSADQIGDEEAEGVEDGADSPRERASEGGEDGADPAVAGGSRGFEDDADQDLEWPAGLEERTGQAADPSTEWLAGVTEQSAGMEVEVGGDSEGVAGGSRPVVEMESRGVEDGAGQDDEWPAALRERAELATEDTSIESIGVVAAQARGTAVETGGSAVSEGGKRDLLNSREKDLLDFLGLLLPPPMRGFFSREPEYLDEETPIPENSEQQTHCVTLGSVLSETALAPPPDQALEWRRFCAENGDYWAAIRGLGGVHSEPGRGRLYSLVSYPHWTLPEDANPCSTYIDEIGCIYDFVPADGQMVPENWRIKFIPILRRGSLGLEEETEHTGQLAVVGDSTNRGGEVISGSATVFLNGKALAREGDRVLTSNSGVSQIQAFPTESVFVEGRPVARSGNQVEDGSVLVAGERKERPD